MEQLKNNSQDQALRGDFPSAVEKAAIDRMKIRGTSPDNYWKMNTKPPTLERC